MLYQANAATLTLFTKENKILLQRSAVYIIEFPDKGWTKNSINRLLIAGEVEKVRNSRHVNRQCE